MIKAVISDLYKVLVVPIPGAARYEPTGFNLNEVCTVNLEYLDILASTKLPVFFLSNYKNVLLDFELNNILAKYKATLYEAGQLGLDKASTYAYEFIAKNKIGIKPEESLVIDDTQANVEAALRAGATAVRYESNQQIRDWLKTFKFN
jgi:FMN phosphatase YigB (HAD superfamily)